MGRVALAAGSAPLAPGGGAFVQLRLEEELVANLGDRFVLRSYSPVTTIGGGRILLGSERRLGPRRLAELAPLHQALFWGTPAERLRAVLEDRGARGAAPEEAALLASATCAEADAAVEELSRSRSVVREGGRLYAGTALTRARRAALAALEDFHARERIRRGMPLGELRERAGGSGPLLERALGDLAAEGRLIVEQNQARLADRPAELGAREAAWRAALLGRFETAGLEPPALDEALAAAGADARAGRALVERLAEEGLLTKVSAVLYFHAATLRGAREAVHGYLSERPFASVGELKDLLGLSRKYLIPLLEHFDREGLTRRTTSGRSLARS
jgi:selenocysteine-specific elongation factor